MKQIEMCDEMKRLREFLDKKGIHWIDDSDDSDDDISIIYRTKFEVNNEDISVIFGHGTCGGVAAFNGNINHNKLEMRINHCEPEGWLTADDIIKQLELYTFPDKPSSIGEW